PNNDALVYTWSSAAGTITGTGSQVVWASPLPVGTYTVSCDVSDGRGGTSSKSVDIVVMNQPPVIGSLTAMPVTLAPGGTSTIICTATDPNNDTIAYTWSSTAGTITGTGSQVVWTSPQTEQAYTITCTVSDEKGGKTQQDVIVYVDKKASWAFITDDSIYSSPAIGTDGTIYVGSCDGFIYAITSSGSERWRFGTIGAIYSSPAIGTDGTIYVGSDDCNLYAIAPNGSETWHIETEDKIFSSPAIGNDGTIYVGSWKYLYAIAPNGTVTWKSETVYFITSSPAIGTDGTIYIGSWKGGVYAIAPNGSITWSVLITGEQNIDSSPVIGTDGTIYIGSCDNKFYAINHDGTNKWEFSTGGDVDSTPAIGDDGTIYVGSSDNKLYAINQDGTKKWEIVTGSFVRSS
ncbi:MAG: PQQ-binding-like beta-propeller repeat protein, partial [Candidatus Desantisbacteria bacterium]